MSYFAAVCILRVMVITGLARIQHLEKALLDLHRTPEEARDAIITQAIAAGFSPRNAIQLTGDAERVRRVLRGS